MPTPQFIFLDIEDPPQSCVEMGHLSFFLIAEVMRGIFVDTRMTHISTRFLANIQIDSPVPGAKDLKTSQHPTPQAAKLNSTPRACVIRIVNYSDLVQRPVGGRVLWELDEAKFGKQKLYCKKESPNNCSYIR